MPRKIDRAAKERVLGDGVRARYATAAWVEWDNNDRLHSRLGEAPTVEFEQNYYAVFNRELQAT